MTSVSGLTAINHRAGTFWRWWLSELSGLAPAGLRQMFAGRTTKLVLDYAPDEDGRAFTVASEAWRGDRAGRRRTLTDVPLAGTQLTHLVAKHRKLAPGALVVLRLPYTECLSRAVSPPASARSRLTDILGLDIERVTPFRRDQVYFDHVIAHGPSTGGRLQVEQVMVEKARVDPLLAALRGWGIGVDRVECWNRDGTAPLAVNLLARAPVKRSGAGLLTGALALAALLLGASVVWLDFDRYDRALGAIDAQLQLARKELAGLRKTRDGQAAARAEASRLMARKQQRRPAVALIDDLARALPEDSWLTSLHIEGQTVDLFGFSKSTTALVQTLQADATHAPGRRDVRLTAPITFDTGRKAEQFSLRLSLAADAPDRAAALTPSPPPATATE